MARVVVVGGGVIGCAVAERLSRDRHHVVLLERDQVGSHASGAAAGLLAPYSEAAVERFELASRSLAMFPELVTRIERDGGVEVEYRDHESLTPALTAEEERRLRRGPGRWLDPSQALSEEPELNPRVRGAAVFPEGQLTPSRFVRALVRSAIARGVEVREGAPVAGIVTRSGRVEGVRAVEGVVRADVVVLAAGPWSPALASPVGVALDVRPNRGQLVSLLPLVPVLRRMITWQGSYLVPKPDGTVVAGSTEEEAGFDARVTAEGIAAILGFACRAVPRLRSASVERVWAALRPATPDGKPLIGPAHGHAGLVLATGHNRNGILLAPITAEIVASGLS